MNNPEFITEEDRKRIKFLEFEISQLTKNNLHHPVSFLGEILANVIRSAFKLNDKFSDEKVKGKYECELSININGKNYSSKGYHIMKKESKGRELLTLYVLLFSLCDGLF